MSTHEVSYTMSENGLAANHQPAPEAPLAPAPPAEPVAAAPPVINMRDIPLGTLIYRSGLLTAEQLESALAEGSQTGKRLGEILVERGWLGEPDLARLLAGQKGLPFVDLRSVEMDPSALRLLPQAASDQYRALAIAFEDDVPVVAIADPANETVLAFLQERFGSQFKLVVASRSAIEEILSANAPTQILPIHVVQPEPAPAAEPVAFVAPAVAPPAPEAALDEPMPAPAPAPPPAAVVDEPQVPAPVALEQHAPVPQPPTEGRPEVFRVVLRLTNGEQVELFDSHDEASAHDAARDIVRRLISDEASGWPYVSGRFVRPGAIVSIDVSSRP